MGGSFGICGLKKRYIAALAGFDKLRTATMTSSKTPQKSPCDDLLPCRENILHPPCANKKRLLFENQVASPPQGIAPLAKNALVSMSSRVRLFVMKIVAPL